MYCCRIGESDNTSAAGTRPERLSAVARRSALLDIAFELLLAGGEAAITIGSVAERANVTRTLVYKHFENRNDVIVELHRRERTRLDDELIAITANANDGFEPKLRAMVRGLLDAAERWGTVFNPLRRVAGSPTQRERRLRDRRAVAFFTDLAVEDYGLPPEITWSAMRVLLGGLEPLMWQVPRASTVAHRDALTDLYVGLVLDALAGLVDRQRVASG